MVYETKKFTDGQITAKIIKEGNLAIKIRGNTYSDLFKAAAVKEAWDAIDTNKLNFSTLSIQCLIAQRSDRRFNEAESFDLKIIAKFINQMKFDRVEILHPHSSIALALIDKAVAIDHFEWVKKTYEAIGSPVLISPDAGAYKTTHKIAERLRADLVPSNKVRIDGSPHITIQGNVKEKVCLIVDDLADGGRTFMYLAKALKKQGATKVFLYVTHGQFNHGFNELKETIDHVYCTNSYKDIDNEYVTQFKVI